MVTQRVLQSDVPQAFRHRGENMQLFGLHEEVCDVPTSRTTPPAW